jgi:hypothetical protein
MIDEALKIAFDDVFERLGVEVLFQQSSPTASFYVVALVKEPESVYEVGSSQVIGQVAGFTVKAADVTPKVGDSFFLGSKKYKIHAEPLLDASNLVWKFNAVLVEK